MTYGTGDYEKYSRKRKSYYQRKNNPLMRDKWASDKQHTFAENMLETCKKCNIDTSFLKPDTMTKDGCKHVIESCKTLLAKNGFGWHGEKINEEGTE